MKASINEKLLADGMEQLFANEYASQQFKKFSQHEIDELYHAAYHFYQGGKYAEAIDFFRTLTAVASQNVHYWSGLASALKMHRQYEKALEAFFLASIINHNDPYTHAHAAECCFALGKIEQGLITIDTAISVATHKKEYRELMPKLEAIKEAWSKEINIIEI